MPIKHDPQNLQRVVDALEENHGNQTRAAAAIGISRETFRSRLASARLAGYKAGAIKSAPVHYINNAALEAAVLASLRRSPKTLGALSDEVQAGASDTFLAIEALQDRGHQIANLGGKFVVSLIPQPAFMRADELPTYGSRPDGTYVFGACGDNHLGSKYAREDVLNELYDLYEAEGVDRVFNTGNWIDGEARFNMHDLKVHGLDAQMRYLARNYPGRPGIVTYAVAGDDHEGWYAQREGIDIGKRAEQTMREAGREDWVNLGYMESHIRLIHADSGAESILACVHPGGGSSYAVSYSIQKIIESLDGGEKPAVGLYGHYHKLWAGNIRNVWCIQTGTTEDQTPFMRKKKLEAHVGGTLITLHQDPKSGAITRCKPELIRYFNKGFYNNRWSHGDDVQLARRAA